MSAEAVRQIIIDKMFHYSSMAAHVAVMDWHRELRLIGQHIHLVDDTDIWIVEQMLDDGRLLIRNITTLLERIIDNGDSIRYID